MHHEERALVNGVPCVRVSIREYKECQDWPHPCEFCPLDNYYDRSQRQLCDSSCGGSYIWVDLASWIGKKLEAA